VLDRPDVCRSFLDNGQIITKLPFLPQIQLGNRVTYVSLKPGVN
jgi:hypothetical protein